MLGLTLPLTGVQSEIAQDLLEGYRLAALSSGGQFELLVLDDESKPDKTAAHVAQLVANERVLATSGIVGTPHAQAALPIAVQGALPVFGIRSGAQSLRQGQNGVIHLRSTYESELERLAQMLRGAGYRRVQVLYSDDSFGKACRATLERALQERAVDVPQPILMERNGANLAESVAELAGRCGPRDTTPTAIVLLVISAPAIQATQMLRQRHRIALPVFAMSHVVNRHVASKPMPGMSGFGAMLAFPLPRSSPQSLAVAYREATRAAAKLEVRDSLTAFEGFFYGSVFAHALKACGRDAQRGDLIARMRQSLPVHGWPISLNAQGEGFQFIDLAYKDSVTGLLRV